MTVITRFAPSPTGSLHIGGARTALFNYLWARHNGGKFLLRIEDTDAMRNKEGIENQIVEALTWLGLDWDDALVKQSDNAAAHVRTADDLLRLGAAYRDFTTDTEMEALRAQHTGKGPFRYDSPYRDNGGHQMVGRPHTVRMKVPRDGESTITDHVQGKVTVKNSTIEDFVLLKSDGKPTFLLAGAVDDIYMGVNWVIRGDDHLNNAFKQKLIYDALGEALPNYAHIPLIHNAAGKKYSKRDGAAGVEELAMTFEPDAVFNYLLRLGWGHGNDEIISREQAVEWFDVAKVGRNPAKFDIAKLMSLNAHYLRAIKPVDFAARLGLSESLSWLMPEVQKRATTLNEARNYIAFLDSKPPSLHETISLGLIPFVSKADWTPASLKVVTEEYCESNHVTLREVATALRWSLAGKPHTLGIFDMMAALGREETLERLAGNSVEMA